MGDYVSISKADWDNALKLLVQKYAFYAPVNSGENIDYKIISEENIPAIIYNTPKPTTPLKLFMNPVKQLVSGNPEKQQQIICGVPACDLMALNLLDEMYLDNDYTDIFYKSNRERSILIGTDCFSSLEHCHCVSANINPFPEKNQDLSLARVNGNMLLAAKTEKGETLLKEIASSTTSRKINFQEQEYLTQQRTKVKEELKNKNKDLPGYSASGDLIKKSSESIWKKYAETCVACGACATICPTCTCFLLIDKPAFEKIKQLDACQYPAFEKVAAGEDPLKESFKRFRNRYLCKYIWKPEHFDAIACTGCGRCIECCIGDINKNELLTELAQAQ